MEERNALTRQMAKRYARASMRSIPRAELRARSIAMDPTTGWIGTHIEDVPPEEMAKRAQEWQERQR